MTKSYFEMTKSEHIKIMIDHLKTAQEMYGENLKLKKFSEHRTLKEENKRLMLINDQLFSALYHCQYLEDKNGTTD